VKGDVVLVNVDDEGMRYPLKIDPFIFTERAKLTASDGTGGDRLGFSIAVGSGVVVVGAPEDAIGANAAQGSAYLFLKGAGATSWTDMAQTVKLTASDGAAGDHFGSSVAIDSGDVVVGAPDDTIGANAGQGSGYAYGYFYDQSGGDGGGGGGGGAEGGGFKNIGGCFISSAGNGVTITRDGALFFLLLVVAVLAAAITLKNGS
jgi:hypothetical protein